MASMGAIGGRPQLHPFTFGASGAICATTLGRTFMAKLPRRESSCAAGTTRLIVQMNVALGTGLANSPSNYGVPLRQGVQPMLMLEFSSRASRAVGQQVIVENVSGAENDWCFSRGKAPPDGLSIRLWHFWYSCRNQTLYKKPLYDAANDFSPVVMLFDSPLVLFVA